MNSNNRGTIKFKVMIGLLIGLVVVIMGIGSLHLYDYTGRIPRLGDQQTQGHQLPYLPPRHLV
jgi:hypothetical protein